MSNYYYGPALDGELDYRRDALRHDAALHRLARQARRTNRGAIAHSTRQPALTRTAAVRPATADAGVSTQPAGCVERPAARAA